MRSVRLGVIVCLFLLNVSAFAQTTQQTTISSPALKDPQAVSVVNQALALAGGVVAFKTVADYTSTGVVTYHFPNEVSGPVTVRERGLTQLRVDAQLSAG